MHRRTAKRIDGQTDGQTDGRRMDRLGGREALRDGQDAYLRNRCPGPRAEVEAKT